MSKVTDAELEEAVQFLEGAGWRIVTSARTLAREDLRQLLERHPRGRLTEAYELMDRLVAHTQDDLAAIEKWKVALAPPREGGSNG